MFRRWTLMAFLLGLLAGCEKTNDPPTTPNTTTPGKGPGRSFDPPKQRTITTRGQ